MHAKFFDWLRYKMENINIHSYILYLRLTFERGTQIDLGHSFAMEDFHCLKGWAKSAFLGEKISIIRYTKGYRFP